MKMRNLILSVFFLGLALPVAAQPVHQATPVDQLLRQYHEHHRLLATSVPAPTSSQAVTVSAAARSFTVVARQFTFAITPGPFVVNQGDTVTLDVTSSDVTHGFFLEQYFPAGVTLPKGQHHTITFVASTAGSFTYACTVASCGSGHSNMFGELVVNAPAATPSISSYTPRSGPAGGGTVVALSGANFQNGAAVKFGETPAVSVTVNSTTSISAVSPSHSAGDVVITVTNPDGQSATASPFTYTLPGPTLTSIAPNSGSTAGGTSLTLSGSGFAAGATVTVGGAPAGNVVLVSAGTITAVTPPGPFNNAGNVTVDVTITNTDGRSVTAAGGFTYTLPPPSISSLSPTGSVPEGGTSVVITGAGFTTGLPVSVTFGGTPGTNVRVLSPTSLAVVVPAHAAGTVDVSVTVGSRSALAAAAFTYQAAGGKRRAVRPR